MKLPKSEDAFLLGMLLDLNQSTQAWEHFMQVYLQHFNLRSCHLMVVSSRTQAMRFHVEAGEPTSPEFMKIYLEKYIQHDQVLNKINRSPTGHFYATNEIHEEENVYDSDYFLNFAQPQGMAEGAAACAFTEGEWRCIIGTNRNAQQGKYSRDELERMDTLLPYIEKAIKTTFQVAEHSKSDMRSRALVNTFRIPVAALTEYGEIWAMNDQMKNLIENDKTLYIQNNSLHSSNKDHERMLSNGPIQIHKRVNGLGMDSDDSECFRLNDKAQLAFQELTEEKDGQTVFLGVLVYAVSEQWITSTSIQQLMDLFSLSPAEAQVCKRLSQGCSLKEIAKIEQKSVNTVREQLYRSFEKTGCNSQVSLMNLMATLPYYQDPEIGLLS